MRRYIIVIVCAWMAVASLWAQQFKHRTLRDGLAGLSVTRMVPDPSGKMWLATSNGVSLYNGWSLKNYTIPNTGDNQPPFCNDIDIDNNHDVWVASQSGVFRLERTNDNFAQVGPDITSAECILCDDGNTYVGNPSGLYVIYSDGRSHTIDISGGQVRGNNSVRCIRSTKKYVWFSVRTGLMRLDKATEKVKFFELMTPSGLSRFDIIGDSMLVGTKNNGLYVFHPSTGKRRQLALGSNVVNDVKHIGKGLVCVASDGAGAGLIDADNNWKVVKHLNINKGLLPTDACYTYIINGGTDWVGMFQAGFAHSQKKQKVLERYAVGDFTTKGMKVTASIKDGNRRLIAVSGGVWVVDEDSKQSRFVNTFSERAMNISHIKLVGNKYYIGSYDGGLLLLDRNSLQLSRIPANKELGYATISDLTVDKDGRLWVTSSEGIFVISKEGALLHNYTEKNSKLPRGVTNTTFDKRGNAWIGYVNGMCLWMKGEDDFKTDGFPEGFFNKQPRLNISLLGDTIIARSTNNVYLSDIDMHSFKEWKIPSSIMQEKCFDMLPIQHGYTFIVTEKGLFRIKPGIDDIVHLSSYWGMTGQILSTGTLGADENYLWIGTSDGLIMAPLKKLLSPTSFAKNIKMEFDEAFVGQHELSRGKLMKVNDNKHLDATWHWVTPKIVLKMATMDYGLHEDDMMEYRIDDGEWLAGVVDEAIELRHLGLGKHILEVRLTGMNKPAATYEIHVSPSIFVYIEITAILVTIGLFVWWWRWRKRTKQVITEHIETEDALIKEIKDLGGKYANSRVSHDEMARIFQEMDKYVRTEKPYLNCDSKMSDIASAIGVSPSQLSQVFTLYVKEPYYDYINRFRLEEFKRLIAEDKHNQFTITALSEQSGFKKTSFFSTFRKVEGTTPTEWIQKQKE